MKCFRVITIILTVAGFTIISISHFPVNTDHQQQMLENVKKCKNFLSTLIKLASSQPEATVRSVRDLIQGLIVSTKIQII